MIDRIKRDQLIQENPVCVFHQFSEQQFNKVYLGDNQQRGKDQYCNHSGKTRIWINGRERKLR